jgi:hypothetical protein
MARGKTKTRVVYRKAQKVYRKSNSGFSSVKKILNPIMIGFGGSALGNIIGTKFGINPMIPSAIAGFIGGGKIGAITAIALPMILTQGLGVFSTGAKQETSSGTVWS